jgi:peptide chain release factor 2
VWNNQDKVKDLGKRKIELEKSLSEIQSIRKSVFELHELGELVSLEWDGDLAQSFIDEALILHPKVDNLEFRRMFCHPMDGKNAYIEIQAGSGGTEAQDWANMLMRMYLRWIEKKGFSSEIEEISKGEVVGIKGCMIKVCGSYAYGWLRTESGIHRLVRKSPFDSSNKRHTSFASVHIIPEIDDDINIEINPADLRIDTYRASGAGGQHINKTDSAIRITHIPTNTVVQCQSQRSQHKNKAAAFSQLKARLYEIEQEKQQEKKDSFQTGKASISWGNQIRSYILDDSRIKDLRTRVETGRCSAVLDGDIDIFLEASLKQQR